MLENHLCWCRLCGSPPFWHRKQMMMLRSIMQGNYTFSSPEWDDISDAPKDLVSGWCQCVCICVNAQDCVLFCTYTYMQVYAWSVESNMRLKFLTEQMTSLGMVTCLLCLLFSFDNKHIPQRKEKGVCWRVM